MQPTVKDAYEIEIPDEKAATYRVVTFIIALINAAAFSYLYFNETNRSRSGFAALGMILGITALIFYCIKTYTKNLQTFKIEIAFILLALIWFICGNPWLSLLMLLSAFLGFYTNKRPIIRFTKEGIVYPSFPPKKLLWREVDFAMVKEGILTIEMKDNHVFQFTLSATEAAKLDENDFNGFCSNNLLSA